MAGRVLVVDDEESILITMQAVLEQADYAVATASTGAVASRLLQETTFDVALVDLRQEDMPRSTQLSMRCAEEHTTT